MRVYFRKHHGLDLCVYVCGYVCRWMCVHLGVRGQPWVAFLGAPFMLRQALPLAWSSSSGLDWQSQRQGSAGLCLPITGMVSTCHQAQLVHMGSGGVYSVPHDCMAVILLTSSLPSPVPRFSRSVFKPLGMYLCGRISCLPHEDATIA